MREAWSLGLSAWRASYLAPIDTMPDPSISTMTAIDNLVVAMRGSKRKRLLMLSHAWGGGVERHLSDLLELLKPHTDVLVLRGFLDGGIEIAWYANDNAKRDRVRVGGFEQTSLSSWVEALDEVDFSRLHIHHLHGWPIEVLQLVDGLDLPIDITLHDYFYPCPQYHLADEKNRYCGEPDVDGCRTCVAKRPHSWGLQIDAWREAMGGVLRRAERTKRYFPAISPIVLAHPEPDIVFPPVVKVAILGGLSEVKGLRVLAEVANTASHIGDAVHFRVVGHASEPLPEGVTATGTYDDRDLPRLIAAERPDVIWFPNQVPETYSYTLTVALAAGIPIAMSDFPSFRERGGQSAEIAFVAFDAAPTQWISAFHQLAAAAAANLTPLRSPRPSTNTGAIYVERYLQVFENPDAATSTPLSRDRLSELLYASPAPSKLPDHAIVAMFRIGRYGGHRDSLDAVERQLASIPEHERQIVGRSVYEQVLAVQKQFEDAYERTQDAYKQEQAARFAERDARLATLERVNQLETSARRNAELIEQLHDELSHMRTSRSWRYTRPFRAAMERLSKFRAAVRGTP
jgi:O-antigen biosynthesis protein